MNLKTLSLACIATVVVFSIIGCYTAAQTPGLDALDDDDDANIRENPIIEDDDDDDVGIEVPSFINEQANHITLNGSNFSNVTSALSQYKTRPFSIVHIGDSHLQADISTATVRELMQYDFGNAGRGLVIPFKMAGTNQPVDYSISSSHGYSSAKILRRPWSIDMGFTGIALKPLSEKSSIFVATRETDDYNPFLSAFVFHTGKITVTGVKDRDGKEIPFRTQSSPQGTLIKLGSEQSGITIDYEMDDSGSIFGINLSGDRPGVFYHVIGNNGATYASYASLPGLGEGVAALNPNLIILSLGTNEAFGTFNATSFKNSMKQVVDRLRAANPGAQILLVTPMECQRSVYNTVSHQVRKAVKVPVKGKGKKKKYKTEMRTVTETTRTRSHGVNTNVAEVRQAILDFAAANHIPVYDWYEVAGGQGASSKWIEAGLYGSDRVHHTVKGYRLTGYMLYDALKNEFKQ